MKRKLALILFTPLSAIALSSEQAYLQLAQALKAEGNQQEAIVHYKNVLQKNAQHKEALLDLALIYHAQNAIADAAEYFDKLSQVDPQNYEAFFNAGACNLTLNNFDKAITFFQKAAAIKPQESKTYFQLGVVYKKTSQHENAIKAFEQLLQLTPNNFEACHHIAASYRDLYQLDKAMQAYDKALQLQPSNFQLLFEKANMLTQFGRTQDSIEIYAKLLATSPQNITLLTNLAFAQKKQGDYALAIENYKKVIAVQPNNSKARMSLGYAYLTIGDFETGFKELAASNATDNPRLLRSKEHINGKTIFIPAQWCMEDLIQFIRYAQLIKDHGGKVHVQVNAPLLPLLKNCPFIDKIIAEGQPSGPFDYYISLSSLPALFNTTAQNVPNGIPYIQIPEEIKQVWHLKLRNNNSIRIGIYYHEPEIIHNLAENKNIPLQAFAPFAQLQDINLYSLQPIPLDQLKDLPNELILSTFGSGFNFSPSSLVHIAAILENLDLIITRDSMIAHIAGAFGRPVFVALPYHADWRWMLEKRENPWYPSMRLFRQKSPGDWSTVIEDMITTFTTHGIAKQINKN